MPGLEDLEGCIATMKNTQNIFDAMKLIVTTNVWKAKEVVSFLKESHENAFNVNFQLQTKDINIPLNFVINVS